MAEARPRIDVIVPVYNAAAYLPKCVDSLLAQDFDGYVITLVDDGSNDGSSHLCDAYAEKAPDRVRVIHQANAGASAARNGAAARSEAEYICFVDCDDHVAEDFLSSLWGAAEEFVAPMAVAPLCREYARADGSVRRRVPPVMDRQALDRDRALAEVCFEQYFGGLVCGRLTRRDLVLAHPFPVGRLFEDSFAVWRQVMDCDTVAYTPVAAYFYLQRKGSLQRHRFEPRHLDFIPAVQEMMDAFTAADLSPAVLAAGSCKVCRACYVTAYHAAADLSLTEFRQTCGTFLPLLREHLPAARATGRLDGKTRLLCRTLLRCPPLFYAAVRLTRGR